MQMSYLHLHHKCMYAAILIDCVLIGIRSQTGVGTPTTTLQRRGSFSVSRDVAFLVGGMHQSRFYGNLFNKFLNLCIQS